jgi:hypothetical protein
MSRTWATAALPGVIGRPGSDFNGSGPADAFWPPLRAAAHDASEPGEADASARPKATPSGFNYRGRRSSQKIL